jgi:hypothetical protein
MLSDGIMAGLVVYHSVNAEGDHIVKNIEALLPAHRRFIAVKVYYLL